jgi:hypothetical protein
LIPLVAGALIFSSAWISNYDPFITGTRGYGPQDPRMRVTEVSALGAEGRVFTVPTDGATRFRYTFSIVNDGPVAVTITGVGSPLAEPHSEVFWHPVRVIPDEQTPGPDGNLVYEPWHAFALRPGKEAGIEMLVIFRPTVCLGRGTTLSWWPESIRYSVFGIPRRTTFESNLEVHITGTTSCPGG